MKQLEITRFERGIFTLKYGDFSITTTWKIKDGRIEIGSGLRNALFVTQWHSGDLPFEEHIISAIMEKFYE